MINIKQCPKIQIKPKQPTSFKRPKPNPTNKTELNPNPAKDQKNQHPAYALKSDDGKTKTEFQILSKNQENQILPMPLKAMMAK